MKILILYYSRTGTTKLLAEKLAKKLNADIEEIIDNKSRKGPLGYIRGGSDAVRKKLTSIKPLTSDINKYDLVLLGSPNWAATITPAIRTVLKKNKSKFKDVAFFQTRGGENNQNVFSAMNSVIKKQPVATLGLMTKEVRKDLKESLIDEFVKTLKKVK